jgi:glycosyltransferase involved in cell wall biosynthesis
MRLLLFNLVIDVDDPILGFATRWIRVLARRVEFIHVITMRVGRVEVPANVQVYSVGKEKGYSEPRRAVEFYRYLCRVLREGHIDACFSLMIPIFTVLAAPVLKLKGIPIVTWYAHRQVTTTLKLAHHLSNRMVASAETAYCYKHDKLVVIGQGIATDLFSPDGTTPESPPLLLSVGRLSPIKDPMTLIEAMHLLRQRGYNIRCALVGDAPERDHSYLEAVCEKVRGLNLQDTIEFAGAVHNEQVVRWYRSCFAHVNLCPAGALDKAALEAMACGKPSLVANDGFRETLEPWPDSLLYRHGDPEDLSRKIEQLLQRSDAELEAIGTDLRRNVIARHSLERWADCLVDLLAEVRRP